jgi:hypothetical protein
MRGMSSRTGYFGEASAVAGAMARQGLRRTGRGRVAARPYQDPHRWLNYQRPIMLRRDSLQRANRGLYTFLRNEPTVFLDNFLCISSFYRYLCRLQRAFAGGFVLENEPNSGGSVRWFASNGGFVSGKRTHSRIVAWMAGATFSFPRRSDQSRRRARRCRGRRSG